MDVPLALNDIGTRYRVKGYKRKSSTFSHKTVVGGLSAFLTALNDRNKSFVFLFLMMGACIHQKSDSSHATSNYGYCSPIKKHQCALITAKDFMGLGF